MKRKSDIGALVASFLIGAIYSWAAERFWGFYASNSPLNDWLLEAVAARGQGTLYRATMSVHDILVNVVFAIPFAALFVAFARLNRWRNLAVAALTAVVVAYSGTRSSVLLLSRFSFWLGLALTFASLPLAFEGLRLARSRGWLAAHTRR